MEDDERASSRAAGVQIDHLAALIRQANVREHRPDHRPAVAVVELGHERSVRPHQGSDRRLRDYHPCVLQTIEPSDEALAARVAGGDVGAFGGLYDRYAARVYAWAAHLLGVAEADDVVQDVFLRLWDKAHQFDPARGRFGAWFGAIARHEIIARARRRGRERRIIAAEEIDELLAQMADPAPSVESRAWSLQRAAELAAAVRDLPVEQRRVIVLAYFGGLSQSEIAVAIATPLGTVKKRTRLALQKLRNAVADDGSTRASAG